jgi:hypothetical protein
LKSCRRWTAIALAITGALSVVPAPAQAQTPDQALLKTFCDPANIQGSTCKKAKNYPGGKACDVMLIEDRYSGKFLAAGAGLLIVSYESGCEAHATDNGGSVVFEQSDGATTFRGFQPGYRVKECIVIPRNAMQDRLACLTGHMGQGILESGVAEMVFAQGFGKEIKLSLDFFLTAEDSVGAYGSNTVTCKEPQKYFGLSRLGAGPRPGTVTVDIAHADAATIKTACRKGGFPRPKEVFGKLDRGDAYVPEGFEKKGRFVIDMATRQVAPMAGTGKPAR